VIRVLIVAASPLGRAGLQSMAAAPGVEVVGSVPTIESLASLWHGLEPGLVLVDASGDQFASVMDSLAASDLAFEAGIVVITDPPVTRWFSESLRANIRAVLPSDISPDQLVAALQAAAAGLIVIHPAEVAALFPAAEPASRPLADLAEPLTPRESEVLQMLASGLANKEIAARLSISEHTVKFHVASILGKLGAGSRTEAVSLGIRRGLVLL
jgi:two-component system, NarL family, response regulator YdfI